MDMLVKLYDLPEINVLLGSLAGSGILVRRGLVPEKHIVISWVAATFSQAWSSECQMSFSRHPVSCFLAVKENTLVGFACYEATFKGYFGPMGVLPGYRGRGIGKALLISCLKAMAEEGYQYAIIGGVGPAEFYVKTVAAIEIPGSTPGGYRGMLK